MSHNWQWNGNKLNKANTLTLRTPWCKINNVLSQENLSIIVEQSHRTIKWIATRKQCSVQKAVYLYNIMPKDSIHGVTAPANVLYQYEVQVKGVDIISPLKPNSEQVIYKKGDIVLIRTPPNRYIWRTGTNL